MTKEQAIRQINGLNGFNRLNFGNTHWSNLVEYGERQGWWLNIPFHKFTQEIHLILNDDQVGRFTHVTIPANSISTPEEKFRKIRQSADIFIPRSSTDELIDHQSGSTNHDFSQYQTVKLKHLVDTASGSTLI